ncbi:hypothetical protein ACVNHC_01915 [Pannonibacter sp. Q-1]
MKVKYAITFFAVIFLLSAMELRFETVDNQYFVLVNPSARYPASLFRSDLIFSFLMLLPLVLFRDAFAAVKIAPPFVLTVGLWAFIISALNGALIKGISFNIAIFLSIFYSYALIKYNGIRSSVRLVQFLVSVAVLTSALFAILGSDYAVMKGSHDGLWRGFFNHKNYFGPLILTLIVIYYYFPVGRRGVFNSFIISILVLILMMTGAKTAIFSIFILIFMEIFLRVGERSGVRKSVYLTTIALLFPALIYFSLHFFISSLASDFDFTLSDRTTLWSSVFVTGLDPFGKGIGASFNADLLTSLRAYSGWSGANSVHSSIISSMINLGFFFGFSIYIWIFLVSIRLIYNSYSCEGRALSSISLILLIMSFVEVFGGLNFSVTMFLFFFFIIMNRMKEGDKVSSFGTSGQLSPLKG